MNIDISYDIPNVKEYCQLRIDAGLSAKDEKASEIGLKNSIFMVSLIYENRLIGMGRVIGDGGCCYQIVDIAVNPLYQGKGFGSIIMKEINSYLDENIPKTSYVSLIADVPADKLYEKFGFKDTSPAAIGMGKKY